MLETVPETVLKMLKTVPETVLKVPGPGTEPGTVLELETVGMVLVLMPELVPVLVLGPGTVLETLLELELEAETEQGNKYSALHP